MGLTAGCAVCHDHKFDPITQKDFYSLSAFFNNTTQTAMDGNVQNTPPVIPVPQAEDRAALRADREGPRRRARRSWTARKTAGEAASSTSWPTTATAASVLGKNPLDGSEAPRAARPRAKATKASLAVDGQVRDCDARRRLRLGRRSARRQGAAAQDRPAASSTIRRRRRLRPHAAVHRRRVGEAHAPAARPARSSPAWTTSNKLPRLGSLDRGRQARHAHHQRVPGGRAQGRRRTTPLPLNQWVARRGRLRRLGEGGRRRRSTSTASRSRPTTQSDTLKSTTQDRSAASRSASGTRRAACCNGI